MYWKFQLNRIIVVRQSFWDVVLRYLYLAGLDTYWFDLLATQIYHLPYLPSADMCCLLWQSLKFKMLQIEAIAQGATGCNFLLALT